MKVALTAETKEMRHLNRALRHSFSLYRRKFTPKVLAHLIVKYFPDAQFEKNALLSQLPADSVQVRHTPLCVLQPPLLVLFPLV